MGLTVDSLSNFSGPAPATEGLGSLDRERAGSMADAGGPRRPLSSHRRPEAGRKPTASGAWRRWARAWWSWAIFFAGFGAKPPPGAL